MPPSTSPAGSRTALITWSVVFAILFVTSTIFAIYFYADSTKARDREETLRKQYSGPAVTTPVAAIERAKSAIATAGATGKDANITIPATDNLANALTTMSNGVA